MSRVYNTEAILLHEKMSRKRDSSRILTVLTLSLRKEALYCATFQRGEAMIRLRIGTKKKNHILTEKLSD